MTPTTMNMLHYIDTLVLASLDMDTLDSMAGGPLMLRPLLQNLDMVMDMAMAMNTAMAMVDMVSMEMARGLLMLSLDMATDTDMELHSVHVSQTDHGFGINPATYTYGYNIGHGYGKKSAYAGYFGDASTNVHQTCPYYHGLLKLNKEMTTDINMELLVDYLKRSSGWLLLTQNIYVTMDMVSEH